MLQIFDWLALSVGSALLSLSNGHVRAAPGDWQRIVPAEAGFAPDLAERLEPSMSVARLPNLHAVVVARGGRLVLERYFDGPDERAEASRSASSLSSPTPGGCRSRF